CVLSHRHGRSARAKPKGLKRTTKRTELDVAPPRWPSISLGTALLCLCAFAVVLFLYSPALSGQFTFDDSDLPFCKATRHAPLLDWISSTGVRPILIVSYWLNYHFWGANPFSYHFVNLIIHCINTGLGFLVLLRLLKIAGR